MGRPVITANLATALALMGRKVAILNQDLDRLQYLVIGVVENMSDTNCPDCGEPVAAFLSGW